MRARLLLVAVIFGTALSVAAVPHATGQKGIECPAGRTCFSAPLTISEPGYYLLTSDFEAAAGNGISVAADDVTVDLNGRTISGLDRFAVGVAVAQGVSGITIRNGRIQGFLRGVSATGADGVTVESVELVETIGAGLLLEDMDRVEIRSCRLLQVENGLDGGQYRDYLGGIRVTLRAGSSSTRIVDNIVQGDAKVTGITVSGLEGGEVAGNLVAGFGYNTSGAGGGITVQGNGSRVARNQIRHCGIGLFVNGNGNDVTDNIVHEIEEAAFTVGGDGNVVERNTVTDSGDSNEGGCALDVGGDDNLVRDNRVSHIQGHGICIDGVRAIVESNLSGGNTGFAGFGCGLWFANAADHVYRGNSLRGNSMGAVCGAANLDAGGNIL